MRLNKFLILSSGLLINVISLYGESWITGTPSIISEAIVETTEEASSHPENEAKLQRKPSLPVFIENRDSEGETISNTHPENLASSDLPSAQASVNFTGVTL